MRAAVMELKIENNLNEILDELDLRLKSYAFTEGGNAERFIDLNGNDLRYCYDFRKWYQWDSIRWNPDRSGAVEVLAQEMIREMYIEAANIVSESGRKSFIAHVKKSDQAKSIRGMLEMARSRVALLPEELDRDPFLLCVTNGTVDLRTGKLREHQREDLISRVVPVIYDESATAPTWIRFLNEIFDGKSDLIAFVQRSFGYGLTGDTREQCIFIPWGKGANGKSTLLNTISDLMGDYAITAATNTFLVKNNDSIPNDVARLRSARLVIAIEVEEGKRLAENMIKQMTGGDRVSARFLRQEWFDFDPEFKPFLAVNHKPEIRGTDHAIWRRIKLIPFSVCFEDSKQDKTLKDKLQAEFPGILNWLIEGCLEWQKNGLGEPEEVRNATSAYRQEMDTLADFISECCVELDALSIQAGQLYKAYVLWIKDRGEQPLNMKVFGEKITERGIKKEMPTSGINKKRWMYRGIGLAAVDSGQ